MRRREGFAGYIHVKLLPGAETAQVEAATRLATRVSVNLEAPTDAQVRTLARHQDATGLWHTLIDDPSSYLEASATAGFAYGILKAVRRRYLPSKYAETGLRAVQGVLDNINADGELKNVSFGTAMGPDLEFYRKIPLTSMPYGQSLAMLALCEFLRTRV